MIKKKKTEKKSPKPYKRTFWAIRQRGEQSLGECYVSDTSISDGMLISQLGWHRRNDAVDQLLEAEEVVKLKMTVEEA